MTNKLLIISRKLFSSEIKAVAHFTRTEILSHQYPQRMADIIKKTKLCSHTETTKHLPLQTTNKEALPFVLRTRKITESIKTVRYNSEQ